MAGIYNHVHITQSINDEKKKNTAFLKTDHDEMGSYPDISNTRVGEIIAIT